MFEPSLACFERGLWSERNRYSVPASFANRDMKALRNLLTKDVVIYTDGGGQVAAPISPSIGRDTALKLFKALARYFARAPSRLLRNAMIDGLPGFITVEAGDITQTSAFFVNNGRIAAVYVTRNLEKLHHLTRCRPHDNRVSEAARSKFIASRNLIDRAETSR